MMKKIFYLILVVLFWVGYFPSRAWGDYLTPLYDYSEGKVAEGNGFLLLVEQSEEKPRYMLLLMTDTGWQTVDIFIPNSLTSKANSALGRRAKIKAKVRQAKPTRVLDIITID